jgi:transposase
MATRRTHSLEFKQSAVDASRQPGALIAGVAMAHGINANQLHKWRRQFLGAPAAVAVSIPSLLPVTVVPDELTRTSVDDSLSGRIDIKLGRTRLSIAFWRSYSHHVATFLQYKVVAPERSQRAIG